MAAAGAIPALVAALAGPPPEGRDEGRDEGREEQSAPPLLYGPASGGAAGLRIHPLGDHAGYDPLDPSESGYGPSGPDPKPQIITL